MRSDSPAVDEDLVFRYMCGRLTEEDRMALEARCLGDEAAYQEVRALEDEWVDRYARGELSPAERAAFEDGFLSSPDGSRRVAFAAALLRRGSAVGRPVVAPRGRSWGAWAAALVLGSGLALMLVQARRGDERAPETIESPRVVSLTLVSGASRGPGGAARVAIPRGTASLDLHARLPGEGPSPVAVDAALEVVGGGTVWRQEAAAVRRAGSAAEIVLPVPVGVLTTQDYVLRLTSRPPDPPREVAAFFFALDVP
jgi:hypothetical protein